MSLLQFDDRPPCILVILDIEYLHISKVMWKRELDLNNDIKTRADNFATDTY